MRIEVDWSLMAARVRLAKWTGQLIPMAMPWVCLYNHSVLVENEEAENNGDVEEGEDLGFGEVSRVFFGEGEKAFAGVRGIEG